MIAAVLIAAVVSVPRCDDVKDRTVWRESIFHQCKTADEKAPVMLVIRERFRAYDSGMPTLMYCPDDPDCNVPWASRDVALYFETEADAAECLRLRSVKPEDLIKALRDGKFVTFKHRTVTCVPTPEPVTLGESWGAP